MRSASLWLSALALILLGAGSLRGADTGPVDSSSAEDQYARIDKEYRDATQAYFQAASAAKTDEERRKAVDLYPKPQQYTPRLLQLAEHFPHTPVAAEALVWVLVHDRNDGSTVDEALKALDKDHLESDKLVNACASLVYSGSSEADRFLRDVMAKSPHKSVRGAAVLTLGERLKRNGDSAEAEKLFEQAVAEFSDVKLGTQSVGDRAQNELFEIHNLGIGKTAPEIEGADIDGKPIKLSDYRGKVVVLDFWGYW